MNASHRQFGYSLESRCGIGGRGQGLRGITDRADGPVAAVSYISRRRSAFGFAQAATRRRRLLPVRNIRKRYVALMGPSSRSLPLPFGDVSTVPAAFHQGRRPVLVGHAKELAGGHKATAPSPTPGIERCDSLPYQQKRSGFARHPRPGYRRLQYSRSRGHGCSSTPGMVSDELLHDGQDTAEGRLRLRAILLFLSTSARLL